MGEGLRWESYCSEISQHSPDNYQVVLTPGVGVDCGSQGGYRVEWPNLSEKIRGAGSTSTHKSTKCRIPWLEGTGVECTCQSQCMGRWLKPKLTLIQAATCTRRELGHFLADLCMCLRLCTLNQFQVKIFIQNLNSKTGTNCFLAPFAKEWMNLLVWFAQHDDSFFECKHGGNGIWNCRERVSFTPIVPSHVATGNELGVGEAEMLRPPSSMKKSRFIQTWRKWRVEPGKLN